MGVLAAVGRVVDARDLHVDRARWQAARIEDGEGAVGLVGDLGGEGVAELGDLDEGVARGRRSRRRLLLLLCLLRLLRALALLRADPGLPGAARQVQGAARAAAGLDPEELLHGGVDCGP